MVYNTIHPHPLATILLFLCCMPGCTSTLMHLYSGPTLPTNQVAVVYAINDTHILGVFDAQNKDDKAILLPDNMLELLPGQYRLVVWYQHTSANTTSYGITTGIESHLDLGVQAGNIYVLYPEFIADDIARRWRPIVVNISEYDQETCDTRMGLGHNCPSKDSLIGRTTESLRGERRAMIYHPWKTASVDNVEGVRHVYGGIWE
jgi:hypothetical protein